MDTLSYALGIGTVVNVAIGVVAVVALVKAQKANKEKQTLENTVQHNYTDVHNRIDQVFNELTRHQFEFNSEIESARGDLHDRIDDVETNLVSHIDSKCDKLENKLINTKK